MKYMGKKLLVLLLSAVLALQAAGCGADTAVQPGSDETKAEQDIGGINAGVIFQDALGYEVAVNSPKQVAALGGSYAETWVLAGGTLAAATDDTWTERQMELSDEVVNLGSLKKPDVEQMILLGIDFVILNAKITGHVELRETLEAAGMTTAYFEVETFEEYLEMLKLCTEITGEEHLYEKNGLAVKERIEQAVSRKKEDAYRVLFVQAHSTKAKAKNSDCMTGAMLKDMGCINIADSDKGLLEDLSMESIILEDPDFIFVTTHGASTEAAQKTLAENLENHPAWSGLTAVKNGRYILLPKDLFHYKPNHRWGESYEMLADILYGDENGETNPKQ